MKKSLLAALAAFALFGSPALADGTTGIVNVTRIMHDSKAATSVRNQLQAKQKDFQAQLDAHEKSLLAEDQALVKQRDTMDKDAFDKKVKDFREKTLVAQREVQDKRNQLDVAAEHSLEEIQKNVIDITKQVAAEKKMPMVLSATAVLYADPTLDITDEVLKRLDAQLPSVTVKF
jgi:outer membrane protein